MPGQPQVRESAWLYEAGNDFSPIAHVRLEERPDGRGWDIYVSDPAREPSQHVRYPDEVGARAEINRLYEAGRARGEWRINRHQHD